MGLVQLVNCQTHRSGNILDLIMIRNNDKIVLSEPTENFQISDHCFIHTYVSLPKPKITREIRKVRKLKDIDETQFQADLIQFNESAIKYENLEDTAKFYNSELRNILDKHAPEKEKIVTIRPSLPWFTKESRLLKTRCRSAERKWRGNKTPDNDHAFRCTKRAYRKNLRYNRYQHINSNIAECGNDSSKMYKLIFGLIGRKNCNPMPPNASDASLAEEFSSFFMDKILAIRKSLDDFEKFDPNFGLKCTQEFNTFHPVSDEYVLRVIKSSKPTTCPTDPIPSKLIKQFSDVILPTIVFIVNKSLTSGLFANEWKTAIVRPLLKKSGLDVILKNYRPVSNLSYISKIVEKCALNQFMKYLESNRLLPSYQSAYRRGFSTQTALLKLSSDILWKMEKQEVTALVALDLSAAFDTVDHAILSNVLETTFGVSEVALHWFQSYLSFRKAEVHINASKSQPRFLNFSVPQGSICGPVLYTVYASTLQHYIKDSGVSLLGYADDHSAYDSFNPKSFADEKRVTTNLEKALVTINDWMNLNKLKLNPSKTEFSLVTSHLDYANSVLYGLPECTIKRLQLLQNRAAKLVLKLRSTDSSTEALKRLHWLPLVNI
ncbi:uncharacterized protein LOC134261111 [Saccostrea cucullata]|uniref:uncharacterized protein LOC134261111 n=1 Tax=Saccostrea cuccullata TaxID=36930 RepID=UPI002ED64086